MINANVTRPTSDSIATIRLAGNADRRDAAVADRGQGLHAEEVHRKKMAEPAGAVVLRSVQGRPHRTPDRRVRKIALVARYQYATCEMNRGHEMSSR